MAPNYPGQIQPQPSEKRDLLVSKGWIQAVAVVVLFGFFVMGLLTYRTYSSEAPIPARVAGPGGVLFTPAQSAAYTELVVYYRGLFSEPSTRFGLRPKAISDPTEIKQLTAFFSWSAWAAAALRPGRNYSYTNNWPPEPLVANSVTADMIVWSMLSLAALLGGIGILFFAFGRWNFLGWHGREQHTLTFRAPGEVALTPAQRVTAWFFLVMAVLFLIQTLVGAASQHYRADITSFFGVDLARILPFNLARTWHLQLAIFWVSTSYLAAGIFFAPMLSGREPKIQKWLATGLLSALAVVVFGSLI